MIDQIAVSPAFHVVAGSLVLVGNLLLLLVAGRLALKKAPFTPLAQGVFIFFTVVLLAQALVGIKLLDQGLGVLQLFIHYLGGLAPLAFIIILSWLPDRGPVVRSRRVAGLAALSAVFVVLTFGVGSMYVPGGI
jgi:hypothetical protein